MAKQKQHAAEMPQGSEVVEMAKAVSAPLAEAIPPAVPDSVQASAPTPAAAPTQPGWIDLNKPMSIEEMHRSFATDSPFLACHV